MAAEFKEDTTLLPSAPRVNAEDRDVHVRPLIQSNQVDLTEGKETMEEIQSGIDVDKDSMMNFHILVGITDALGIILLAMVSIWMGHYRGGFAWDGAGLEFNFHPLFMVLSMVFLYGNGALLYRVFRNQEKMTVKIMHMSVQTIAFVFIVLALIAVFDFHNSNLFPNLYSLHSWLGISTVVLFCFQYVCGFLSFLWPTFSDERRALYLKIHQFFGAAIFILGIGSCLTGTTEKLIFNGDKPAYSSYPAEGLLANVFGMILVVFAGLIIHLVTYPAYKRPSEDHKTKYSRIS